jgi:NAD(P)-dependent dehydrogenase (short-subunit alcohol dehydrogenase family)
MQTAEWFDITGKVAVVTGAGRGIGRGIALAYGLAGAKVVVSSRSKSTVDSVVSEIKQAGGTAVGVTCNVGARDEIFALADSASRAFGPVDILVNNAQSFGPPSKPTTAIVQQPIETFDEDEWEYTMRTGLMSTLWGMKAVFPHMKDRGGKIINLCSLAGITGVPGMAAYGATKEAVRSLTRTAAREWGKYKINVNVINPHVRTDSMEQFEKTHAEYMAAILASIPLGRHGEPVTDAGALAVFLGSRASDYITGAMFMLDGGMTMFP